MELKENDLIRIEKKTEYEELPLGENTYKVIKIWSDFDGFPRYIVAMIKYKEEPKDITTTTSEVLADLKDKGYLTITKEQNYEKESFELNQTNN